MDSRSGGGGVLVELLGAAVLLVKESVVGTDLTAVHGSRGAAIHNDQASHNRQSTCGSPPPSGSSPIFPATPPFARNEET